MFLLSNAVNIKDDVVAYKNKSEVGVRPGFLSNKYLLKMCCKQVYTTDAI